MSMTKTGMLPISDAIMIFRVSQNRYAGLWDWYADETRNKNRNENSSNGFVKSESQIRTGMGLVCRSKVKINKYQARIESEDRNKQNDES